MMFKLNEELSIEIQQKYGDTVKIKGCFENVAKLYGCIPVNGSEEVLFCYLATKLSAPTCLRHAFLLIDGEIIEPLPNVREGMLLDTIVPFARLSILEYIDLLRRDGHYSCMRVLVEEELNALEQSKIIIHPFEQGEFVSRFTKDAIVAWDLMRALSVGNYTPFREYADNAKASRPKKGII